MAGSNTSRKTSGTRSPARCARPWRNPAARRREVAAIGITNQRETVVVWDRTTGRPIHRAIVWQDRRTTDFCREHAADQPMLTAKTGLVLDPYFSGTKLRWFCSKTQTLKKQAAEAETGERHHRFVPDLAAHRRRRATSPTRPTPAARCCSTSTRCSGTTTCSRYFDVPRAAAAGGEAERRGVRRHEGAGLPAGRHPDSRRRGRPASGALRARVLRSGRGEMHLRHRRVLLAAHR